MPNRPDFSAYLAHFAKDGNFCNEDQNEQIRPYSQMSAKDRLFSMLRVRKINASVMPWTNMPSVCFTECPWSSLLAHTNRYSPFGIGFTKEFIFKNGGAPALYMRANIFRKLANKIEGLGKEEKEMWSFATPFAPRYASYKIRRQWFMPFVDFSHEREWRTPKDLSFEYTDIAFIVLKSIADYEQMPQDIKNELQNINTKIIIMDNYRLVEELWPVHKID